MCVWLLVDLFVCLCDSLFGFVCLVVWSVVWLCAYLFDGMFVCFVLNVSV